MKTKETKWTPGPWRAASRGMTDNSLVVQVEEWNVQDGHKEICCIRPGKDRVYGPQNDEDIANAQLIALAPDMVEALRECITEDGAVAWRSAEFAGRRLEAISNIARAILAKLEGGGS